MKKRATKFVRVTKDGSTWWFKVHNTIAYLCIYIQEQIIKEISKRKRRKQDITCIPGKWVSQA